MGNISMNSLLQGVSLALTEWENSGYWLGILKRCCIFLFGIILFHDNDHVNDIMITTIISLSSSLLLLLLFFIIIIQL